MKWAKTVPSYDFHEIVKNKNLKFNMAGTFKTQRHRQNTSFYRKFEI